MKELIQYYSSSLEFRLSFNKFKALAFVLTKDASKAFDLIKNDCPVEFSSMLEYFETWYIGHRKPNSHHCLKPAFHELWSISWIVEHFMQSSISWIVIMNNCSLKALMDWQKGFKLPQHCIQFKQLSTYNCGSLKHQKEKLCKCPYKWIFIKKFKLN